MSEFILANINEPDESISYTDFSLKSSLNKNNDYYTSYINYEYNYQLNTNELKSYVKIPFSGDAIYDIEFDFDTLKINPNLVQIEMIYDDNAVLDRFIYDDKIKKFKASYSWQKPFYLLPIPYLNPSNMFAHGILQFRIRIFKPLLLTNQIASQKPDQMPDKIDIKIKYKYLYYQNLVRSYIAKNLNMKYIKSTQGSIYYIGGICGDGSNYTDQTKSN